MKGLFVVVLFCIAIVWGGGAFAQTQGQMNEQAGRYLSVANHDLATAIQAYRERLRGAQRDTFDKSQIAWESYRRAACDFESSGVSGGSARPMVMAACFESIARDRLKYIEALSTCQEGDLSCPAWKKGI